MREVGRTLSDVTGQEKKRQTVAFEERRFPRQSQQVAARVAAAGAKAAVDVCELTG